MKYLTCLLFFCGLNFSCRAQDDFFDSFLKSKIKFEVKQLGQFFDRFNMDDTVALINGKQPTKYSNVLSLFNMENKRLISDTNAIVFAARVESLNRKIGYHDSDWFAVAFAVFNVNNVKKEVPITLKYIKNKGMGYSWVIIGVDISSLGIELKKTDSKSITPMNNEINFMDLSKALENKKEIASYTDEAFKPDYLTAFLYQVESGNLSFLHIHKIVYHFLNVPGWVFTVENFNRMTYNSGWLISGLSKSSTDLKENYKKTIYTVREKK